jgi:hypothetical protein
MASYNFVWLSEDGGVAAVDRVACRNDDDALKTALVLLRDDDVSHQWRNCDRIEAYLGVRLVHQVDRARA